MSARCVRLLTFPENLPARNSRVPSLPMDVWRCRAMDGRSTEIDAALARLIPFLTFDSGSHPFFGQEVALRIDSMEDGVSLIGLVRNRCDFTCDDLIGNLYLFTKLSRN